jgi:hypothetical protein
MVGTSKKMDRDYKQPKTRQEKKGAKEKQVFSQKHVRAKEALMEKRVDKKR